MRCVTAIFILAGWYTFQVSAQPEAPTGSRIDGSAISTNVVWFNDPDEIDTVRRMLQEGRTEEAVDLASRFVQRLEHLTDERSRQHRYSGLNALCAALMKSGDLDQAIDSCDRAIAMYPDNWRALNNRGTVHFVRGDFQAALSDYNQALVTGMAEQPVADLIRHNIDLVQSRMGGAE